MITGLSYIPNIISNKTAITLLSKIDALLWRTGFKRRVQHYGYIYDYKRRSVDTDMYLGELPHWSQDVVSLLLNHPQFGVEADQMIINEYLPGQGISHHIDCEPCFGDVIASFSLASSCIMSFIKPSTGEKQELLLEPNSLLIMGSEARYDWQHGIPARKNDVYEGVKYPRRRRVSITFRKVIVST